MNIIRLPRKPLSDAKGFSIIEVLIGMSILSIGLLAVAAMQISAVRNNKTGNTFTQATTLAQAQMETIKNGDIADSSDTLNPSTLPTTTSDPNNPIDENGDPGGIYTRTWTVAAYVDSNGNTSNDARTVTVTVSFPFVGQGTRKVSFTSVVAGDGL
ncbi:conserved hypothetical protein [Desulfosarcina cetonica]|uniref:prepilin-type N-terminal cleavage/methylation domain-containing protein n=1 Tax=Desulfosarcina cetonica TaxID=90730 RepID=UPI0006CFA476|nr:prepilin-type N-terminal cleavage/methylation domain-containing protein [Desulfosarcina cetonica]VTR70809.1 conserved hypothetical protein [Desulfosarcina cetonica]